MAAYKLIKLTRGVVAAVSPKDFERVNKHLWAPVVQAGKVICIQSNNGSETISLHRFIMGLKHGDKRQVDHWNGNVYDNRRCNLRICSNAENQMNRRKAKGTLSQYKGIYLNRRKQSHTFPVYIKMDGHRQYLGCFATEIEAAHAYDTAARKYFGEFAHPNFPTKAERGPEPPPEVVGQKLQPTNRYRSYCNRKASKFVGVFTHKKKWRWVIMYKGKYYRKHGFSTQLQAAKAREAFIIKNDWPHQRNFS